MGRAVVLRGTSKLVPRPLEDTGENGRLIREVLKDLGRGVSTCLGAGFGKDGTGGIAVVDEDGREP